MKLEHYKLLDGSLLTVPEGMKIELPEGSRPATTNEIIAAQSVNQIPTQPEPTYADMRRAEYPPFEELAEALREKELGDHAKWTAYTTKCDAVKTKYPKPE